MFMLFRIFIAAVFTSLYFFPIDLPGIAANTKMIMAVLGLCLFVLSKIQSKNSSISNDFIILSLWAFAVSLMALFSTTYNHTSEKTFTSYIISFWVWIAAAYAIVLTIKWAHGTISLELIGSYLVGVCVFQCISAYIINISPPVQDMVDNLLGTFFYRKTGRLYGIGAFLDPAGLRMGATLIINVFLFLTHSNIWKKLLYLTSFAIILVGGSMISRTTSVGAAIALIYMSIYLFANRKNSSQNAGNYLFYLGVIVTIILAIIIMYQHDVSFQKNFRFAFESFFNYFEHGSFSSNSTNILAMMLKTFPETIKTWCIGDGYIENPIFDPNYLGEITGGFYKATDVGYLRYIFYFGVIGLVMIMMLFIKSGMILIKTFPKESMLFFFLISSNFIFWVKVSSDIIMVLAPFLCLAFMGQNTTGNTLSNQ